MSKKMTIEEFINKGGILHPSTVDSFLLMMQHAFHQEKALSMNAVFQFCFTGRIKEHCYLIIDKGTLSAEKGMAQKPDVIITTPYDLWISIIQGKEDGRKMFLEKKYQVRGNMPLFMKLGSLFSA